MIIQNNQDLMWHIHTDVNRLLIPELVTNSDQYYLLISLLATSQMALVI